MLIPVRARIVVIAMLLMAGLPVSGQRAEPVRGRGPATQHWPIGALSGPAFAKAEAGQQPAEPPNPLGGLKSLKCRFPAATSASWKGGEPVAQTKTQELMFDISEIDVQDGTAEFRGTACRAFVT